MRLLCVCDQGNSRSPTIASLLRYRGHETLPIGASTSSQETRDLLAGWCDSAILVDQAHLAAFPTLDPGNVIVWPIADVYPRPFNPELRKLVLALADREGL